jgi:threonine/homoserine/homoserine lactone efflux protein
MSINLQPGSSSQKPPTLNIGLIVSVGSQVGLALIGIILVAILVGLGIDALLQTDKHPFTILLFLGSVPFSLVATYWLARRATQELNTQNPAEKRTLPLKEEGKRE